MKTGMIVIASMVAGALMVAGFLPGTGPSRSDLSGPLLGPAATLFVFLLFLYCWYAAWLTWARLGRTNIYYVDRATVRRLDAQAEGGDPPPLTY